MFTAKLQKDKVPSGPDNGWDAADGLTSVFELSFREILAICCFSPRCVS